MIETGALSQITELEGHPLVATRVGTVFRLSADQAMSLFRAWGGDAVLGGVGSASASEGSRVLSTHYRIERKRWIIESKKASFRKAHGRLFCEVCGLDHNCRYGEKFDERLFEVHHVTPLGELAKPSRTTHGDLTIVCRNCHALIHRSGDVEANLVELQEHFQGS